MQDKALLERDGVKNYGKVDTKRSKAAVQSSSSSSSSEEEGDSTDKDASKKRKRETEKKGGKEQNEDAGKPARKGGVVIGTQKRKAVVLPDPSKLTGVLGHMFTNGGFLSGEVKQKEQDWLFDEATQEKIAVDAHNNKVTGKKGVRYIHTQRERERERERGERETGEREKHIQRERETERERDKAIISIV